MDNFTFPHATIDIQDNSGATPLTTNITPLHVPFFFIYAEDGPIGVPVWGSYAQLQSIFGSLTFAETSSFYQHPTIFAKTAAQYQNIFVIRLADSSIVQASLVLEAIVTQEAIPQYQIDGSGAPILDSNGNKQPLLNAGVPVTQPGVSIKYQVRALAPDETISTITTTNSTDSDSNPVTTYPILASEALYPGSRCNRFGWSLYYTPNYDQDVVAAIDSMTYRFAPVFLATPNTGTASMIYDNYGSNYNDVSFKAQAIDSTTNQDVSLNGILANNYVNSTVTPSQNLLDYTMYVYSNNVQTIGAQIITLSPEITQTLSPFMINILSAIDQNGNPYQHFILDSSSANVLNQNVIQYNLGGTDGTLTKADLETLTVAYVSQTEIPDFQDNFRYPFTHFYDSGYALASKIALMNILSLRDDVKIDFTTQDVANAPNTAAQDESIGASILSNVLLYPESTLFGTEAIRASIYQQCGLLAPGQAVTYTGWVGANLDRLVKRCLYNNATYVKGSPKGRPNSEVTTFKQLNWTEATITQKQINWNTALNTIGYADMTTLFYADLRSVYPNQTSLLSDDVFVDYLIYLEHLARQKWTYYAGLNTPVTKLFSKISNDIDSTASIVFRGALPTTTTVYQTAANLQNGYSYTISIAVVGTLPDRIWNIIIPVSRATS